MHDSTDNYASNNNDAPVKTPVPDALSSPNRRALLGTTLGGVLAGSALGAGALLAGTQRTPERDKSSETQENSAALPFYGTHQAGIDTAPQDHLVFGSFALATKDHDQVQTMLARFSAAMSQLSQGHPVGLVQPTRPDAVPADTGEADGMGPANLTLTLGFGPGFFDQLGLEKFKPDNFFIPAMPADALDKNFTGGDLCIQCCADDPQVAYHALRNLARMARGVFTLSWTLVGFGRASAGANQQTPRNLLGFKDGTRNLKTASEFDQFVWCKSEVPAWLQGGSFLAVRKIQMLIEVWDRDPIGDQQTIFGRTKVEGAPLTGTAENDTPNFAARSPQGEPVISARAHIRLASHEENDGIRILRRSYNYTDGMDSVGRLSAGLIFLSYQNAVSHFVTLQSRLGKSDLLNEYIRHVGSALFAVPPGLAKAGDYFGKEFFV